MDDARDHARAGPVCLGEGGAQPSADAPGMAGSAARERAEGEEGPGRADGRPARAAASPAPRAPSSASAKPAPGSAKPAPARGRAAAPRAGQGAGPSRNYAAIDLGTNNCRLLIARPTADGFEVVDAFSRIVRLGEGLAQTGRLNEAAMARTVAALRICASKMRRRRVSRARVVATEACRTAGNAAAFAARVARETGLTLDVVSPEEEARLAVLGCAPLLDRSARRALVFDIGGGSTELVWLDMAPLHAAGTGGAATKTKSAGRGDGAPRVGAWASLPAGVVTLSDRYGGRTLTPQAYDAMVAEVQELLAGPIWSSDVGREVTAAAARGELHLLGTSGTVTTIAGIHLGLPRYDRSRVDGTWIGFDEVAEVTRRLRSMSFEERARVPCIGRERADLVLSGCAILEAIQRTWPCQRLRVADRGLREGILLTLMRNDRRRRRRRRGGRRTGQGGVAKDSKGTQD